MARKRPSLDDPDVQAELCRRISEGKGIWEVCRSADMPHRTTVWRRCADDPDFAAAITRAREAQQDALVDDMHRIAAQATAETWQVARLRIWTTQWTAAKMAAKKYGQVTTLRGEGAGGAIPVRLEALSDTQLADFARRVERAGAAEPAGGDQGGAGPPTEDPEE